MKASHSFTSSLRTATVQALVYVASIGIMLALGSCSGPGRRNS